MAEVATFADIDIAPGELERRVRPDAVDHLNRALQVKQRRDLDQAADRDHRQDSNHKNDRVFFEDLVPGPE